MAWNETDFLGRLTETVERFNRDGASRLANELISALNQGETRQRPVLVTRHDEPQRRVVLALVPQRMEPGGQLVEVEGDPVGLMRLGGCFDGPRPVSELSN